MSNEITEKYFEHYDFSNKIPQILAEIKRKTGFNSEEEIFRGQIYDSDKVASVLYKGEWQQKTAVLKIQGLEPKEEEIDIINNFNKQNKSKKIRLPTLYTSERWNSEYSYLIMEYIDSSPIYTPPFANNEEIEVFCDFYEEFKTKAVNTPFFLPETHEKNSLVFSTRRVIQWSKIAESKNELSEKHLHVLERFLSIAGHHLPEVPMEFTHGHLSTFDIFKKSPEEFILMSNLFWSYRPKWYDTTFHLWASIKSIRDKKVTLEQVLEYLDKWMDTYKKIPIVQADTDFEKKFNLMMLERCIGALLVDITNQHYSENKQGYIEHLANLFESMFDHFAQKLS